MLNIEDMLRCDGCGVEILWSPVVQGKRRYCCADCRDGLPCECRERLELGEERRKTDVSPPSNYPG